MYGIKHVAILRNRMCRLSGFSDSCWDRNVVGKGIMMEGKKSLFELAAEYQELQSMIEDETDLQVFADTLEAIDWEKDFNDKADAYVAIIQNMKVVIGSMDGEIKAISDILDGMKKAKKAKEAKVDRLKQNLCDAMIRTENQKFKTDKHSFWTQDSKSLKIDEVDAETIPLAYQKHIVEVDKDAIREALDSGKKIEFARYEEKTTLRFR